MSTFMTALSLYTRGRCGRGRGRMVVGFI